MKVTIDHHVVVTESVELPDVCPGPNCDYAFDAGAELVLSELAGQDRWPDIVGSGEDRQLDWNDVPEASDGDLQLQWSCPECGHVLASASELRFWLTPECDGQEAPPAVLLDLLRMSGRTA